MEHAFFKDRLSASGITAVIPDASDRELIHTTIFELGRGVFKQETKDAYLAIVARLVERGAKGVIFGCTEIPLLLTQADCNVPVFDTTQIHATAAVDFALGT